MTVIFPRFRSRCPYDVAASFALHVNQVGNPKQVVEFSGAPAPTIRISVSTPTAAVSPAHQEQLSAESRPHRSNHAERSRPRAMSCDYFFKHFQYRTGRKIAATRQTLPRGFEFPVAQAEGGFDRFQNPGAARMY